MLLDATKLNRFLLIFSIFCMVLLSFRMLLTESLFYGFLVWNLFLAMVPYGISSWLTHTHWIRKHSFPLLLFLGIWLLFLPNAPYVITDLKHLRYAKSSLSWFDPFMLFAFALNSLLYGVISIQHIFQIAKEIWNRRMAKLLIFFVVFLCGFGIYLGRYLRWNSWEFFTHPFQLIQDCIWSLIHPSYRIRTWGITVGFGSFLWFLFLSTQKIYTTKKASRS